jgi:hypothetical protein
MKGTEHEKILMYYPKSTSMKEQQVLALFCASNQQQADVGLGEALINFTK